MTSLIILLQTHLEESGLESVFRVYDNTQDKEVYLLKNWGLVLNKLKIDEWIESLKTGLNRTVQGQSPPFLFNE